jgi:hypothetical protein
VDVDFTKPEIRTLNINGPRFEQLLIKDEPIGSNDRFGQLQFYPKAKGTALIGSIKALQANGVR